MVRINKEKFLKSLIETKDASAARFATDVEVWKYYELRWEDSDFAAKCDKILGFKDRLTEKNLLKEIHKGNTNAIITLRHRLDQDDLFMKLYFDHGIEPFGVDNMKDLLAAHTKVLGLVGEGELSLEDGVEISDILEEKRMVGF